MDERDKMIDKCEELLRLEMISSTQWRTLSARLADFTLEQTTALRTQHEREVGELTEQVRVLTEALGNLVNADELIDDESGELSQDQFAQVVKVREVAIKDAQAVLTTPTNAETEEGD